MSKDNELKEVQKNIILIQLITAPANIAIGLGIYGIFAVNNNDAFISILNNLEFCYGLVIVGGAIEVFAVSKLLPLWKKQASLRNS